jgi:hypothetical protein
MYHRGTPYHSGSRVAIEAGCGESTVFAPVEGCYDAANSPRDRVALA